MARHTTRTTRSYLAGIGASGALLACALVGFLSLLGAVSVSVWPEPDGSGAPEVVELQAPPSAPVELNDAEGLIASADAVPSAPAAQPDRARPDRPDAGNGTPPPREQPSPVDDAPTPDGGGAPPAPQQPSDGGRGIDDDEEQDLGKGGDEGRGSDGDGHGDDCDKDLVGDSDEGEWDGDWDGGGEDRGLDDEVDYVQPDEASTEVWGEPHDD